MVLPKPTMKRSNVATLVALLVPLAAAADACSTSSGAVVRDIEDAPSSPPKDAGAPDAPRSDAGADASSFDPSRVCAQELAYLTACKKPVGDINCGVEKFEAWCASNQAKTDSAQRVRAKAACMDTKRCDGAALKDCMYKEYNRATRTAAQERLVQAYCDTCEKGDAGCVAAQTTYRETAGPDSVNDVFLAAWELSEALTVEITTKCTGAAFADAGADAGSCTRRFGQCAGSLFVDALPDCPK